MRKAASRAMTIQRYAIRGGAEEFKKGWYERIFTTGGPVEGIGGYINDYNTSASVAGGELETVWRSG